MTEPIHFVELCAGGAATTLQLLGGSRLVPPVNFMGGKRRYARAILDAMGIPPRTPVQSVLLADASEWGWIWPLLLEPDSCAAIAAILRGWSAEDPVQLWRRLADEPVAVEPARRAASWLWVQGRAACSAAVWIEGEDYRQASGGERRDRSQSQPVGQRGSRSGRGLKDPQTVARRIEAIAEVVARWLVLQSGNYLGRPVSLKGDNWVTHGFARPSMAAQSKSGSCYSIRLVLERVESLGATTLPWWAVYHGDVLDLGPIPGAFVLLDPPYENCTGYEFDLARDRVLETARRWSDAGCVVAVCEAVPLALEGWHHVEMTPCGRKGSKPEWLTMNREPAAVPARQLDLLAAR